MSLDALLRNPPVVLSSVFACPHFWVACQTGHQALLDYLFTDETVEQIFDGIFVSQTKLSLAFAHLLTLEQYAVQSRLVASKKIVTKLHLFLQPHNPNVHRPKLAGLYASILTPLLLATGGAFGENLPGIGDFLIHNLTTLAYRNLSATIILNYPTLIPISADLFQILVAEATDQNRLWHTLPLIRVILTERPAAIAAVQSSSIVGSLLRLASDANCTVLNSVNALEIVRKVMESAILPEISEMTASYEHSFDSIVDPRDCRLPVLVALYPVRVSLHLDPFLHNQMSTFYGEAFVSAIRSLPTESFCGLIESSQILIGISNLFAKSRIHGHLTQLAHLLISRAMECKLLITDPWQTFVNSKLIPHLQQFGLIRRNGIRPSRSFGEVCPIPAPTAPPLPPQEPAATDTEEDQQVRTQRAVSGHARPPLALMRAQRIRDLKPGRPKRMSEGAVHLQRDKTNLFE
jgi:hypothetical protein